MFWGTHQTETASDMEEQVPPVNLDPQAVVVLAKSKEEKRFLIKLDIFLLTFGCISQVIKYLDQTNISNAYVSGMSDDLQLNGDELNYFTTYFNIGYCLFIIPSQVLITRLRPSLWLSSLELFWGVLTGCIAACKNAKQIYVLRAFIGIAESSAYPGTVTLLMTWYTPSEMAKRIGFYHSCQAIGAMLSGALQTAIHESLEGAHGIAGWRWLFIINCVMTVAVAICGPVMIPDFPDKPNPRAIWFSDSDKVIAENRLKRYKRATPNPISFACLKRTILNPILYHMIFIYVGLLIAPSGTSYFNLWLKSLKKQDGTKEWSVSALNAIPIAGAAMQMCAVWFFAFGSDILRTRWIMLLSITVLGLPSGIIMSIWNVPNGAKYFSYFSLYLCNASGPPLWAWMSDMLPADAEGRALIIGICIAAYYAINAWANVLIWPAKQAPHYRYGWPVSVALWVSCAMVIVSLRIYDIRVIRPRNYKRAFDTIASEQAAALQSTTASDLKSDTEADKSGKPSVRVELVNEL